MSYTFAQVKLEMIEILKADHDMKLQYKPRSKTFHIKWKQNKNYASGQQCYAKMVELYEAMYPNKVDWNYFLHEICEKYVEIKI